MRSCFCKMPFCSFCGAFWLIYRFSMVSAAQKVCNGSLLLSSLYLKFIRLVLLRFDRSRSKPVLLLPCTLSLIYRKYSVSWWHCFHLKLKTTNGFLSKFTDTNQFKNVSLEIHNNSIGTFIVSWQITVNMNFCYFVKICQNRKKLSSKTLKYAVKKWC